MMNKYDEDAMSREVAHIEMMNTKASPITDEEMAEIDDALNMDKEKPQSTAN